MQAENALLTLAQHVDPAAVRAYAKARGWVSVESRRSIYLLHHPTETLRQIQIPLDTQISDFSEAMLEVARRLQEDEHRPIKTILEDFLEPDADVLRYRIESHITEKGSIPIEESIRLLEGVKKALLATACSVNEPKLHHPRLDRSDPMQLLKACRLGQTEYGSFVIKMICPLDAVENEIPLFQQNEEPFTRKVTQLMLDSAYRLVEAINKDRISELLDENLKMPLISANFCDALMSMNAEHNDAKLELGLNYAPTRPVAYSIKPRSVIFNKHHFRDLETICSHLKEQKNLDIKQNFVGYVEKLMGDWDDQTQERAGKVLLKLMHDDSVLTASASLSSEEHQQAIHAYEKNRNITIQGILRRTGRMNYIFDHSDFKIID